MIASARIFYLPIVTHSKYTSLAVMPPCSTFSRNTSRSISPGRSTKSLAQCGIRNLFQRTVSFDWPEIRKCKNSRVHNTVYHMNKKESTETFGNVPPYLWFVGRLRSRPSHEDTSRSVLVRNENGIFKPNTKPNIQTQLLCLLGRDIYSLLQLVCLSNTLSVVFSQAHSSPPLQSSTSPHSPHSNTDVHASLAPIRVLVYA